MVILILSNKQHQEQKGIAWGLTFPEIASLLTYLSFYDDFTKKNLLQCEKVNSVIKAQRKRQSKSQLTLFFSLKKRCLHICSGNARGTGIGLWITIIPRCEQTLLWFIRLKGRRHTGAEFFLQFAFKIRMKKNHSNIRIFFLCGAMYKIF